MSTPLEPPSSAAPPAPQQPRRRRLRWVWIAGLSVLALAVGLGLFAWYWVRSGRVNTYVANQIVTALKEYGIRAEVGGFEIGRGLRTAALRDLKLYNQQTGQLIATVDRAVVTIEVRDRFALRLKREVAIQELQVSGLNLHATFDAEGRSNFDGVHLPPPRADQYITFDTSALVASLGNSALHYKDDRLKLEGRLGNLKAQARPLKDTDPAAVRVEVSSTEGQLKLEGREAAVTGLKLNASASNTGAQIDSFELSSDLATLSASGKVENFQAPRYDLQAKARVFLDEATRLFAPDVALKGEANFDGQVAGEGANYRVTGGLTSDELIAAGVRVRGVEARDVKLEPKDDGLSFSSPLARAGAVAGSGFTATGVSISGVNGTTSFGDAARTEIKAAQASAARVNAEAGATNGATLRNVTAELGDGTSVRGDLTLAGGSFGKASVGQTRAQLVANLNEVKLNNFTAALLGGGASGSASLNLKGGASRLQAQFKGLQTAQVAAAAGAGEAPLAGTVTGRADVSWPGTNVMRLSGAVNAEFAGQTSDTAGAIPVTGTVAARATNGVLNFDQLSLRTDATTVDATGSLALTGNSNLSFTLASTRAEELLTVANSVPAVAQALSNYEPLLTGAFRFEGTLAGPLADPTLAGELNAAGFGLHDTLLGGVRARVAVSPAEIRLEDATLTATNGGTARTNYAAPRATAATAGRLDATFERLNVEDLIAASGIPFQQKFVKGEVSGEAHLTGLPAEPQGSVNAQLANGTLLGQPADATSLVVNFDRRTARVERFEAKLPQGTLTASGSYDIQAGTFQAEGRADQVNLANVSSSFELGNVSLGGTVNATFSASGKADDLDQLKLEVNAQGQGVTINGRDAGELRLTARTSAGGRVDAELVTGLAGQPQPITASIELKQPGRPITVESTLRNFDLTPLLAIFAPGVANTVDGQVSGRVRVAGPLFNERDELSLAGLRGNLTLTEVALDAAGQRINVETPVTVTLADSQLRVERTRFYGQNTGLNLGGVIALGGDAGFNFSLDGDFNLDALNLLTPDFIFGGTATADLRLTGTGAAPRLAGEIRIKDLALSSLDSPVAIDDGQGRIVFAGDRVVLESFTATANDGAIEARGEVALAGLQPAKWQFNVTASDINLFQYGARIVANGQLTLNGTPQLQTLTGRVTVPIAEYTSNFSFEGFGGSGGGGSFSFGSGFGGGFASGGGATLIPPINLDIRVEAPESFLIRNEQVNTVASALLNVTGTVAEPDVTGRVTLEGGTIEFRGQRYEITTGTMFLPGGFGNPPQVNLLAEGDVRGYRVLVGLVGPLDDMQVTLRSEPDLARSEILALITTGSTEGGTLNSETIVRSGLGTAASLLSEEFISAPLGRGAEKLLGLNRFQIDPVLQPNANPAARLTIGRQIARNLTFTYSTNLSSEQDQTVIVEYNLTNRFSAIASYTQGGSSTRQGSNDNDFTIEVRGRKRFALGSDRDALAASGGAANTAAGTPAPPRPPKRELPRADAALSNPDAIKIGKDTLRELLPVMREGYSRALVRLGERNLTNYLQEKGYFFAEVRARCEPASCSGPDLRVLYDVQPGERYNLTNIRLTGTDELDEGDVVGGLESQQEGLLGGVPFFERLPFIGGTARGITSNDRLRNDREAIRRRMADLGFRSARVSSRLAVSPETNDLTVIFDVEEGPRSVIADVALGGNAVIESDELQRAIPVEIGEPFSPTAIREGAQRVRNYYTERGFLDVKVEPSIVDLPDNRVRLLYSVTEGERAVVKDIAVTGHTITKESSIRRFFDFKPGTVLTPQLIERTQRELYATGAFREVNVRTTLAPGGVNGQGGGQGGAGGAAQADGAARDVTVQVTEAKPLLLVYGLGYSTDEGPRALAQLTHTNLFGRVNTGSLKLRGSKLEQLAQISFTDQRPFGSRWATTFSTFYNRNGNLRPFVRRQLVDEKEEQNRAGRSFGINRLASFIQSERKFGEQTSVRLRYSFERAKLFNLENIPDVEVTRNERAVRLGIVSAGSSRDTRDSILTPTRGQLVSADYSLAAKVFGGNESFQKLFANYQRYHTLGERFPLLGGSTLAFSARLGLSGVFQAADRDGSGGIEEPERRLPISERFFAGGATTLRGFRFEEAGPQGVLEPRTCEQQKQANPNATCVQELPTLVPLGGDALAVLNFELRYPLTRRLQLVPFYDVGNVFRNLKDVFSSRCVEPQGQTTARVMNNICAEWTNTVGFGLRFNTPLGPVGVDYGYLLNSPTFLNAGCEVSPQQCGQLRRPRGVIHIRFGQTF